MLWLHSLEICKSKLLGFRLGYFLDPDLLAPRCYVLLCRMAAAKMWPSLKGKPLTNWLGWSCKWGQSLPKKGLVKYKFQIYTGRWFHLFVIFPPYLLGEDEPILSHIFQMGWNHQLAMGFQKKQGIFTAKELLVWRVCKVMVRLMKKRINPNHWYVLLLTVLLISWEQNKSLLVVLYHVVLYCIGVLTWR